MNVNAEFIQCVMTAWEEGIKAQEIEEECACRFGLSLQNQSKNFNPQPQE